MEFLQHPRHIFPEYLHRGEPFPILMNVALIEADPHVPVARTGHHHLADEEEMVHSVERVDGPPAPYRHDRRPHFTPEHIAVRHRNIAGPVDQRLHLGRDIGKIGRGGEDDPIRPGHLFNTFVRDVARDRTQPVLLFGTLAARNTAVDLLSCQLYELGFDPLLFQLIQERTHENRRVTILPRTPTECHNGYGFFRHDSVFHLPA